MGKNLIWQAEKLKLRICFVLLSLYKRIANHSMKESINYIKYTWKGMVFEWFTIFILQKMLQRRWLCRTLQSNMRGFVAWFYIRKSRIFKQSYAFSQLMDFLPIFDFFSLKKRDLLFMSLVLSFYLGQSIVYFRLSCLCPKMMIIEQDLLW